MGKKPYFFVITLLIIISNVAGGQSKYYKRSEPTMTFGIKTGINYANQSSPGNDGVFETKSLLLLHVGGYYSYRLHQYFIIQPELILSAKGSHWTDRFDDVKDIITYLDMPVLLKYHPVRDFNIHLGPQPGYTLKALQKDMKTGVTSDISYAYRKFDLGMVLGVEATVKPRLKIILRYVRGLMSATNDDFYEFRCYNNYLQLSLSYRLSGDYR